MREIKFRGQLEDTNEWVYGYYCQTRMGIGFITNDDRIINKFDLYMVISETVGQYTGLKDKNGKEIYEGDILKNVLNCLVDKEPFQIIFSADWSGWYWKNANDNWDCFYDSIAEDCEVIGNIHQNPELLEVTNE